MDTKEQTYNTIEEAPGNLQLAASSWSPDPNGKMKPISSVLPSTALRKMSIS